MVSKLFNFGCNAIEMVYKCKTKPKRIKSKIKKAKEQ